MVTDTDYIGAE